jgi:hypothetical protein
MLLAIAKKIFLPLSLSFFGIVTSSTITSIGFGNFIFTLIFGFFIYFVLIKIVAFVFCLIADTIFVKRNTQHLKKIFDS